MEDMGTPRDGDAGDEESKSDANVDDAESRREAIVGRYGPVKMDYLEDRGWDNGEA